MNRSVEDAEVETAAAVINVVLRSIPEAKRAAALARAAEIEADEHKLLASGSVRASGVSVGELSDRLHMSW